jgi:formate dehydrogenase subunit delta
VEQPPVIRLANDIAAQFAHKPHDAAIEAIARHLNTFWDPTMRRHLVDIADDYRGDLEELVYDVLPLLRVPDPA